MPLQNRVDPFGELHAVPTRGTLMGNRGILHDSQQRIGKSRWMSRAWIACRLDYPMRRTVMAPASYTELFFLDEVTALAAGHRPCFECRRSAAKSFGLASGALSARDIDIALHKERFLVMHEPAIRDVYAAILPFGAAVTAEGAVFMRHPSGWLRWSFDGYKRADLPPRPHHLLTPTLTVRAFEHGYTPTWHPSADAS